jgi:hypothetical protein
MQRTGFALAVLFSIFSTVDARAENTELVPVVMPAVRGQVLSVDLPKISSTEKWQRSIDASEQGAVRIKFSKLGSPSFFLLFRVWNTNVDFEKYVNNKKYFFKRYRSTKIYKSGFNNALGRKTFFYTSSKRTISKDGKDTEATEPTWRTYATIINKRILVEFRTYADPQRLPPSTLTKSLPLFERIARSVKATPASAMAPEQLSRYLSSPNTRLSMRGGYYLDATLTVTLPPGWAGRVVTAKPATEADGQGMVAVELTRRRKSPAGRYEKLTLVLEGIPIPKAFTLAGFLDTAKAHLAAALPNPKKTGTPKAVVMPRGGSRFCYMHRRVRRGVSTREVRVGTYVGKDGKGQDRKVRVYTAGGFTMACNVIYAADPTTFEEAQERIGAILNSLRIEIESTAKTELVPVVLPAVKGYVISVDLPKTGTAEKWTRSVGGSGGEGSISFYSRSANFSLLLRVYDKPASFERYVKYWNRAFIKGYRYKIYEKGFNNALGRKTFFFLSSNQTISMDGKEVQATKPTGKSYFSVFEKRAMVRFFVYVGPRQAPPLALTKSLPLFERIARSIKVKPASAMPPGQLSRYFSSPNTRLSKRRGYYLNATITVTLPPGWAARVADARHATGSAGQGRVAVELTRRRKSPAGRYEKLTLVLQGIPIPKAFTRAGFLDTAKAHLAEALANPNKIETPKAVAMPGGGSRFCYMHRKVRRGESTGKVYVGTYAGKDRDGQDRKVRVYTAGGFTMACNVIYAADPRTFEESQERIGAILRSLRVEVESPVLGVR